MEVRGHVAARGLESVLKKWTKSDETRRKARNVTETKISRVLVVSALRTSPLATTGGPRPDDAGVVLRAALARGVRRRPRRGVTMRLRPRVGPPSGAAGPFRKRYQFLRRRWFHTARGRTQHVGGPRADIRRRIDSALSPVLMP